MAILESPASFDTTSCRSENHHHRQHFTVRRRLTQNAAAANPLLDSNSNSLEAETVIDDSASNQNGIGTEAKNANEVQRSESVSKCNENGENINRQKEAVVKFKYRPSAPAHRRIKESPLSSNAIFKQPSYPRTTCIRKGWVVCQLIKLVIFTGFMGFIVEQYINPIVQNSQHPLKGNLLYAIERILKLSVPVLYVWLCMFYCFFHLWLNILAELLCFGDREFYKDWWNARTVEEYWRMWNMPVHKWMVRHIYIPSLQSGIPKGIAILFAFFVSAIFHEVPLVLVTNYLQEKFKNSMVRNMIF